MDIVTLILLGTVIVALALGAFFGLIFLDLLIYAINHLYPWLRKIAVWAAQPRNLFSLLVLAGGVIILIVFGAVLLHSILLLILIIFILPLFFPIGLGILVWVIKLIRWLYRKWRGALTSIYTGIRLQLLKLKIKTDVHKGKDWDSKFADLKSKLSEEADQARRRISGGGK